MNKAVTQADLDYDDIGLGDRKFALITAIELIEHLRGQERAQILTGDRQHYLAQQEVVRV